MSESNKLVRDGLNGALLSAMQGGRRRKNKNRRTRRRNRKQQGGSRAQNEERVGYGFRGGVQESDTRHFMGSYAPFEKMSGGKRRRKSRRRGGKRKYRRTGKGRGRGSTRFRRSRHHKKHSRRHTKRRSSYRGGGSGPVAYTPSMSVAGVSLDKHSSALANPPLFKQTNHCVDTYKH